MASPTPGGCRIHQTSQTGKKTLHVTIKRDFTLQYSPFKFTVQSLNNTLGCNKGLDITWSCCGSQFFSIAPDKDWRQLGIYPPLFDLIGYFKFKIVYLKFLYWVSIRKQISNETGPCFSRFFVYFRFHFRKAHWQY